MPDKHKKPQAKITKPPTGKKPTPKSTTSATKPKKDFRNTGIITSASGLEALGAEESLRITLDYTYGWEYWIAPDGRILYMSPSCQRITGHKREDFIKKPVLLDEIIHPDDREMLAGHNETIDQGPLFTTRYRINTKNDGIRWIEHVCQAVFGEDGTWLGRRASNRDINEQKRAEEEVLRINRELRAISDCNQAMVRAKSEYELCTEVCRIMCEKAGYRMAWVGIAEHDKAKSVRPCGCGGAEDGYLSEITVTWADNELGRGPTGLAIRKGKTQFMQDFDSVPSGAPWRKAALARGYRSSIALPLKDANGKTFAAFMLYADQTNAFIPAEVKLLEELAGDLAFGIMAISDRMNREKAEVALKESEEKFRAISNYSQVLIAVNSIEDGTIIYTNPSYAEAFGYSQDEMLGKKSSELFLNPDERNRGVEKLLTNGYIKDIEFQVKRKDGSPFWVSTSATLIEYAGKKVVLVASLDITERKQAQLALEESEEKFRAVAENAQVMIGLSSLADGTILYVNPRYLATYGFTPEELIGKKGPSLFVDPKARKILVEMLSKHGSLQDYELQVKKKDGSPFWISASLAIINYHGEKVIISASLDITERKEQEQERQHLLSLVQEERDRIAALVQSIPDEVWFADINKNFTLANPRALEEFGMTSNKRDIEEMAKSLEVLRPDGTPRPLEETPPILALEGKVIRDQEEIIRTPATGELRWRSVNAAPVKNTVGDIIGSVSVVRDITERKEAEEKLRRSEERFRSLFASMSEGVCEHEIIYSKKGKPVDYMIMECNPTYEQITQIKRDDAVGKTASELYGTGTPPYFDIYTQVVETGEPAFFETYFPPMGKHFAISVFSPGRGKFVTVFQDVTERKRQAEVINGLAKFPEENPNAVLRVTHDGRLTYSNTGSKPLLDFWKVDIGGLLPTTAIKHLKEALKHNKIVEDELNIGNQVLSCLYVPVKNADYLNIYCRDVTARKLAEEKSSRAYTLLEAVTSGSEVIIAAVDQDYRYIFFNQAYREEMVKLTGKEIALGDSMLDVLADMPEQLKVAREQWADVLGGQTTHRIVTFGDPGKHQRTYSVHHVPLLTPSGAVFGAGEAAIDVTDLEQARKELQKAHDELERRVQERTGELILANQALEKEHQRFQDVLDMLPVYIILLDKDYHVPFDNKFFRERFGESFGKRCFEYLFHRNEPCEVCETYKVYDKKKPLEWEWTGPDGHNYYIYDFPFTDTDGSELIMEVGVDITERKKAEDALKEAHDELEMHVEERTRELKETRDYLENLINYANAPIIVWDADSKITLFNHAFERLTGRTMDEMLGQKLDILFPKENLEHAMSHVNGATKGKRLEVEEIPIQHKDGSVRTVLWNSATLYDENGASVATIAQGQDITERKEAEEALWLRTEDLEQANRELEAFSYSVSHDLRAPLRSIDGFSQLIMRRYFDKLDDKGRDYLDELRKSSQLMAQLMDDILTLSRISRYELTKNKVDLSALAIAIARDLKKSQPEHNVEFVIAQGLETLGDERLLRIVLENLMGNAYKFTGKTKKAKIEIGTLEIDGTKAFFVRDNGVGFDIQFADKLFKPFHRLHTPKEFPGTGIGLASVRRIIERHGGKVWAKSEVDKGATFYFTLSE